MCESDSFRELMCQAIFESGGCTGEFQDNKWDVSLIAIIAHYFNGYGKKDKRRRRIAAK